MELARIKDQRVVFMLVAGGAMIANGVDDLRKDGDLLVIGAQILRAGYPAEVRQPCCLPRTIEQHIGFDIHCFLAISRTNLYAAHRTAVLGDGFECLTWNQRGASRHSLIQHHLVEVAPPHLPGVPREELPIGVTPGDRHEPTAGFALAIDFDPLLARILAPVHPGFESKLPQDLATAARQRLSNMVTRKFL